MANQPNFKDLFLLNKEVTFLNHGSFGATPKPVFEEYQRWQRRLEEQPVAFLGREFHEHMNSVRHQLADYLNTLPSNIALIPNATHGVNIVANSLNLEPGDEILATTHEYGACDYIWEYYTQRTGARYIRQHIEVPIKNPDNITEQVWRGVTKRTRVLFLSHITSPTAIELPITELCRKAREQGLITVIDGAHAPGQIPLDLTAIGADFYTGNCHKWMLAPKGAAFLYVHPRWWKTIKPLVVSWGYHHNPDFSCGTPWIDRLEWRGTFDPAAILSIPTALEFISSPEWVEARRASRQLLKHALSQLSAMTSLSPLSPLPSQLIHQMGSAILPPELDIRMIKQKLYQEFSIEVPLLEWEGLKLIRISVQGYNTPEDIDRLLQALKACIL